MDFNAHIEEAKKSPKKYLTNLLYVSCVWTTVLVLVGIADAATNDSSDTGDKGAGFAAVWTFLLLICLTISGFAVMRKYQTPLSVGILLGAVVMMTQLMFMLFWAFIGYAGHSDDEKSADQAMAAFLFFQMITFILFGHGLWKFRTEIVDEGANTGEAGAMPPPNPDAL
uniref:MARVEL domain-containing protein n=1 Tax=Fibrocapsa japonica TaxID=94617 RepID=A0A7S2V597_9STRA|mmetsp:Transcript_791/g.1149  ORF Transcript_791/g.1149 Transcript_791/m.1149 type:complete len:169 (+) Transcript_791:83-589(+)|eukprot:CAMPEP_0113942850 /NCGR_PEP_ID=MMETSP1339-20121228/12503_1 /TAXON_ID=94617 /ORGANISM="Fibrocapsa japonica" /LENGTH=168 /DNA_ID=CAMNT_0000947503 /DNA_START=83 /DNA_END=589 /DNA_ORIENTATION=+ /assembly_acc=CAM_ASM_000762